MPGEEPKTTDYWELIPIFLSVAQMFFYLINILNYIEKLDDFGDTLEDLAKKYQCRYKFFRDRDDDFYNFYKNQPDYNVCESNIHRSRGDAFRKFGSDMRKIYRSNSSYTPLAMIGYTSIAAPEVMGEMAINQAMYHVAEEKRRVAQKIFKWKTIVGIPVEREGDLSKLGGVVSKMIGDTLESFGEGFNSAGTMFGRALHAYIYPGSSKQSIIESPIGIGKFSE